MSSIAASPLRSLVALGSPTSHDRVDGSATLTSYKSGLSKLRRAALRNVSPQPQVQQQLVPQQQRQSPQVAPQDQQHHSADPAFASPVRYITTEPNEGSPMAMTPSQSALAEALSPSNRPVFRVFESALGHYLSPGGARNSPFSCAGFGSQHYRPTAVPQPYPHGQTSFYPRCSSLNPF